MKDLQLQYEQLSPNDVVHFALFWCWENGYGQTRKNVNLMVVYEERGKQMVNNGYNYQLFTAAGHSFIQVGES